MGDNFSAALPKSAALAARRRTGPTLSTRRMYGDGGAEEVLGEAFARPCADKVFGQQVYPQNAGGLRCAAPAKTGCGACDGSDRPLPPALARAPCRLKRQSTAWPRCSAREKSALGAFSILTRTIWPKLFAAGGADCATNQILYNLLRRGPEFDLFARHGRAWHTGDGL